MLAGLGEIAAGCGLVTLGQGGLHRIDREGGVHGLNLLLGRGPRKHLAPKRAGGKQRWQGQRSEGNTSAAKGADGPTHKQTIKYFEL